MFCILLKKTNLLIYIQLCILQKAFFQEKGGVALQTLMNAGVIKIGVTGLEPATS